MKARDYIRQMYLYFGKSIVRATKDEDLERFVSKFRPCSVGKKLVRIGASDDGGYLLPDDFDGISACFSPGVEQSSTFEEQLADKYGIKSFMADYSVERPAIDHKLFHFEKKFLGNRNDEKFMRLEDWVLRNTEEDNGSDLLLQMDIESSEYPVIIDTPDYIFNKFRIMVIEFHFMEMAMDRNAFMLIEAIFDKLTKNFTVAHIHPNNFRPIVSRARIGIPEVMEFTFLRNDRVVLDGKKLTFPHPLDQINTTRKTPGHLPKCWWDATENKNE